MTCAEFEILLCDYIDGTLDADRKRAVEAHRDSCAACAELARDASGAVDFIARAAEPEVPAELLTRIAWEIPDGRQKHGKRPGLLAGFRKMFQPVLQPKFAMGMAMTILSFSLIGRFAGIEPRQLKPSDLHPVAVYSALEDRVGSVWERVVRYWEGLKVVYEVQTRLRELRADEDERVRAETQPGPGAAKPATDKNTDGKAKQ